MEGVFSKASVTNVNVGAVNYVTVVPQDFNGRFNMYKSVGRDMMVQMIQERLKHECSSTEDTLAKILAYWELFNSPSSCSELVEINK